MAQLGQTLTNLSNYNDEINEPTISAVGHSGLYSDLLNQPAISTIGHTGQYTDVINPPVISAVGHSGAYGDLLNSPSLSTVATSGNYNDLSNKPSVSASQLIQAGGQTTGSNGQCQVNFMTPFPAFTSATGVSVPMVTCTVSLVGKSFNGVLAMAITAVSLTGFTAVCDYAQGETFGSGQPNVQFVWHAMMPTQ